MKDIIYVEKKHFVSVKNTSLRFVNVITKSEKFIPLSDVSVIVFDNSDSYFSNRLISTCLKEEIMLLFCDSKHAPSGFVTSPFGHYQRLKRITEQLQLDRKTKNRLWRKIVMSKINNQAACVNLFAHKQERANFLKMISKQVTEGDPDNREAQAARLYFRELFGSDFRRGRFNDVINASLNYGYAIIRAAIRKELAIHGFEASLGIHHESTENPFNLSDDLIEPYRPFVDGYVYEFILKSGVTVFEIEAKKQLLQLLLDSCVIDGKVCAVSDAIKITIQSLITCFGERSASNLKLPYFVEVGQ